MSTGKSCFMLQKVDSTPKQHPEWKKSDPAAHMLYESVSMKRSEQVNPESEGRMIARGWGRG